MFPSPCGDYGSYPHGKNASQNRQGQVSVPLRGLWFLSRVLSTFSVSKSSLFPSPCGDYGSYQLRKHPKEWLHTHFVSVPLRGLWFLSDGVTDADSQDSDIVSVPLRGLWFLSQKFYYVQNCDYGFRPLAGIMVLIKHDSTIIVTCYFVVSVPLRGLWFLSWTCGKGIRTG